MPYRMRTPGAAKRSTIRTRDPAGASYELISEVHASGAYRAIKRVSATPTARSAAEP
jgi:hypothetical protein